MQKKVRTRNRYRSVRNSFHVRELGNHTLHPANSQNRKGDGYFQVSTYREFIVLVPVNDKAIKSLKLQRTSFLTCRTNSLEESVAFEPKD